ncbi:thymidine kinase [Salipiger abyssi]|uniref:Thymidine kinase n=2 Tax=Salipiger abyssi TaxID=1250539 RepID=A0A1P8UV95_9RHOB|nr:thymidine kinase [Salipiger abyssi]
MRCEAGEVARAGYLLPASQAAPACVSAPPAAWNGAMAKLYFHYSTMNAGKSTLLLQAAHNYGERGMEVYLLTARLDTRAGEGRIGSRIGLGREADTFTAEDDLFARIEAQASGRNLACIFVDEAQFLTEPQVWQLARVADDLNIPVMAYGLRVDFRGQLFPGSAVLLALADTLREVRTICHCGRKATMVIRQDAQGRAVMDGDQVQIGGNETYVSLCRRHWREAMGERAPE